MNNAKKFRSLSGLSQRKLAELTGVSHESIREVENGKWKINVDLARKMCHIFNCSIFELYGMDNFYVKPTNDEEKIDIINFLISTLEEYNSYLITTRKE